MCGKGKTRNEEILSTFPTLHAATSYPPFFAHLASMRSYHPHSFFFTLFFPTISSSSSSSSFNFFFFIYFLFLIYILNLRFFILFFFLFFHPLFYYMYIYIYMYAACSRACTQPPMRQYQVTPSNITPSFTYFTLFNQHHQYYTTHIYTFYNILFLSIFIYIYTYIFIYIYNTDALLYTLYTYYSKEKEERNNINERKRISKSTPWLLM